MMTPWEYWSTEYSIETPNDVSAGGGGFFLLLWLAIPAVTLLLINTLAWQRYYIILIAPWSVLAGCAAVPLKTSGIPGSIRKFLSRKNANAGSI
jgi:hypothetical protein